MRIFPFNKPDMNAHISKAMLFALLCFITLSLPTAGYAAVEEQTTEFQVIFKVNSTEIDPSLGDNAVQINKAVRFLQEVKADPAVEIVNVAFCGTASPEGPSELNRTLSTKRLKAMENLVRGQVDLPDGVVTYDDAYIPWRWLKSRIEASDDIISKQAVLEIIDSEPAMVNFYKGDSRTIDNRVKRLQQLDGGRPYRQLFDRYFADMRMASAVLVTVRQLPEPEPQAEPIPTVMEPVVIAEESVVVEEEPADDWYRKMYIKTNIPAWALLWQNLAVEFDLAKHWSFALPVYWSPYDYGKQTLKFRTLAFVPEFRYWVKPDNTGFFLNAHFGLAYYNYAKNGDYRYQDHDGKTPAIGGGIGLGYRFYFCRNHHWTMEAAIGAGIYKLDYDIFQNTNPTSHGYLLRREKRTFYGIDQAAFTISYSFGLRKKGGESR